jgi:hypothetical protein
MILVGAWLVLIGYGLAYAGVSRINGKQIGLRAAFSTQPTGTFNKPAAAQGATAADQQFAISQSQESTVPGTVLI